MRAASFAEARRDAAYEKGETQSLYNEFFEVFDVRRRSVARYYIVKLDNRSGFIDLFWPEAKQGEQKLEQLARWLEREYPSAAASLREGLSEMFTINRLSLPPRLRKCLSTTNLIDSTHSGVR